MGGASVPKSALPFDGSATRCGVARMEHCLTFLLWEVGRKFEFNLLFR